MQKTVLTHANLFDGGSGAEMRPDCAIYLENETITAVEPGDAPRRPGYAEVNLGGHYVVPGLINLHAHLFGTGKPSKILGGGGPQKQVIAFVNSPLGHPVADRLVAQNAKTALLSGTTTVRAVGDFCYSDVRVRNRIRAKKLAGPRLLVSGPAITAVGGHGDDTFAVSSDNPEQLSAYVQKNYDSGVDWIKICVTGGVMDATKKGEPGIVKMTAAQTSAVCEKAHELGFRVASHTESTDGIRVALENGVDTIEHGARLTPELIEMFLQRGASLTVTLSPALPLAKLPPAVTQLNELCVYNSEVLLESMMEGAKQALAAGIPVGLGTDCSCPLVTPYNMWREVWAFAKYCGVTNAEALHTATLGNAEILDISEETGSIEPGKCADLLVTAKNPLEDLRALAEPEMVFARGVCYDHPKVKKDAQIEEWLDSVF
ncbi:MAG: amidohydrolase family protein [Faecalibacterium sp.]|jgi:imidazolonepropionase-like amidohydrolase|nr:amidohydrolase family protein [Faecalibacterium sp.]